MTSQGELRGPRYQLTDAAAHDFSDLLSDIIGLSDRLEDELGDPQRMRLHVAEMRNAARRAGELMRRSLLPSVNANAWRAPRSALPSDRSSDLRWSAVAEDLPCGHGESVLLVDDDARVCDSLRRLLEQLGYQPIALTSPAEALELVRRQPHRFDLILADLTMPSMSGIELAGAVQAIVQRPFVLMSGLGRSWTQNTLHTMGIAAVLSKPIGIHLLAHTLRVPLDSRAGAAVVHGRAHGR
jgi:CheY-like chemotaxis protein